MKPLLSKRNLAWRLEIPLLDLTRIAREADKHYREWSKESNGKHRVFKVPDSELKSLQRRILRNVLMDLPLPDTAHGGVKGRSPRTNAEQHLGKSLVVNQDVRDFFQSVDHRRVAEMFRREFGCERQTTWLLTRLTTVDGQLPRGAPTSPMIANILLAAPVDKPVEKRAFKNNVAFTRFVDDMTFSGENADCLINVAATCASHIGLKTWRKSNKLKISPRTSRQEVTGLTVNSDNGPSIAKSKRSKIRAAIYHLRSLPKGEFRRELVSIRGRLNYLEQFNKGSAKRLQRHLDRVLT